MRYVLVVLVIAALAVLAGVVVVVRRGGGELAEFPPDVPPPALPEAGRLTAADFTALQLPISLVGYHTPSVDETLRRAADAISIRDARIALLEQRVTELLASRVRARQEAQAGPPPADPRAHGTWLEHAPDGPAELPALPEEGVPVSFTPAEPSAAARPAPGQQAVAGEGAGAREEDSGGFSEGGDEGDGDDRAAIPAVPAGKPQDAVDAVDDPDAVDDADGPGEQDRAQEPAAAKDGR